MTSGSELPSGTVTFLFTDIEGSTRLLKQLRDRYAGVLAEHQTLLRAAFAAHGGQVVDTQGDAFFVVFRRAKDAVGAAAAGQRALVAHSWRDGVEVRVRMGVHTGQAEVSDGQYHGLAVHRASRIGDAAHGGQVLVSQTTRDLLDDEEEESEGIELRDLGEQRLKDLDRPVRLYQLQIDGLPSEFPPLRAVVPEPEELPAVAPSGGRRWWRVALPLAIVLVGAAVAAGVSFTRGGSSSADASAGVPADSVGVFDAHSGKRVAQIPVGTGPSSVAFGRGSIWVTNASSGSVSRVDLRSRTVAQTIQVGAGPAGVAVGGGFVWVANSQDGTVSQIDPRAGGGSVVQRIPVGGDPTAVAFGEGAVWVANSADRTVTRIDPASGKVGPPIEVAPGVDGLAVGAGAVWVTSQAAGSVSRIDAATRSVVKTINVGSGPSAVAWGAGAIWVANGDDATVSRIDPTSNDVRWTGSVGTGPTGIAVARDGRSVWVSNELGGTLSRIDPARNAVVGTVAIRNRPEGIAFARDEMYVAVRSSGLAHRGGTLIAAAADKLGPKLENLDPATGGDWDVFYLTNDGLTTYKRVGVGQGFRLVPDLASALPTPTDGGRTYAFQIRKGIRYSTGELVRPADFRRAIERVASGTSTYLRTYLKGIVGAGRCVRTPKKCDLSRAIVTTADTVTFHLTAPDPDFLYKLAIPFAVAVPAGTPLKAKLPLPATGPYMVSEYDRKRGVIRLVRNPRFREWSAGAQPEGYPDVIVQQYGYTTLESRLQAVERATADLTYVNPGNLSPARLSALRIQYGSQLHATPQLETTWYWLHTRVPPFDDVRVRRAVSYAIDRNRMLDFRSGFATPTCQVVPPNMFGYHRYCPYTVEPNAAGTYTGPDLARARQLVAASGTKGMAVTVWTIKGFWEGPPRYLVSVLQSLGYKARLKAVNGNAFSPVADSRRQVQADGPYPWLADYPTPSTFLSPLLTCAAYVPRSTDNSNWGQFCDPRVDALLAQALSLQNSDPHAASILLGKADRAIVDQAPVVPFMTIQTLELVSKRVGNYTLEPLGYGALLDQLWVK